MRGKTFTKWSNAIDIKYGANSPCLENFFQLFEFDRSFVDKHECFVEVGPAIFYGHSSCLLRHHYVNLKDRMISSYMHTKVYKA